MPQPVPPPADPEAARLLAEMTAVRGRIEKDAARVADAAGRATDWTVYVKAAPLACAAGAAAVGYLLVPPRKTMPKVVKVCGGGAAAPAPVSKPVRGRGPWMGALGVLGNVAVRAGTAYISQRVGKQFGEAAASGEAADPPRPRQPAGPR